MARTTEELQSAIEAGIVTKPIERWEKVHLSGEQYLALTSNAEVLTAGREVIDSLPFPLSLLMGPVFTEAKMAVIDAIFSYDVEEVEATIREHCPEVSKDYDSGVNVVDTAIRAVARSRENAA